jgi:hypothetical protein
MAHVVGLMIDNMKNEKDPFGGDFECEFYVLFGHIKYVRIKYEFYFFRISYNEMLECLIFGKINMSC